MKHPKWLLLSWIPVLVALTLISNEALAEHWQWKKLSDSDEAGTTPPARALGWCPSGRGSVPKDYNRDVALKVRPAFPGTAVETEGTPPALG